MIRADCHDIANEILPLKSDTSFDWTRTRARMYAFIDKIFLAPVRALRLIDFQYAFIIVVPLIIIFGGAGAVVMFFYLTAIINILRLSTVFNRNFPNRGLRLNSAGCNLGTFCPLIIIFSVHICSGRLTAATVAYGMFIIKQITLPIPLFKIPGLTLIKRYTNRLAAKKISTSYQYHSENVNENKELNVRMPKSWCQALVNEKGGVNKISLFVMESAVLVGTSRGLAVNNDHGLYMETEWIHTVLVIILYLPPSLWRE